MTTNPLKLTPALVRALEVLEHGPAAYTNRTAERDELGHGGGIYWQSADRLDAAGLVKIGPGRGLVELSALGRARLAEHRGELELPRTADEALKTCPRCGESKPRATGFQHRSNGTVFSWCRECNREYARARAAAKRAGK